MRDFVTIDQKRSEDGGKGTPDRRVKSHFGLATRTLVLIVAFIMLADIIIYVPIVANHRENWLRNRLAAAYTAALVLEAAPRGMVSDQLSRELLDSVGARVIVLNSHGARQILAATTLPPQVDEFYDLRRSNFFDALAAAYRSYTSKGRVITVMGEAPMGGDAIEVTMDEAKLTQAMHHFARRVFMISLAIAAIVACLAAAAINLMVLRPMRRLTTNITEFGADPENAARIIAPSGSKHEIGRAEEALATMQDTLVRELNQKKHLAALGLAVAKINHDLRNMLASAQLLSDRLANVTDPLAQRLAPKLVATLDRAIRFCQAILTYGRAADEAAKPRLVGLRAIVVEAAESVGPGATGRIEIVNKVPEDFEIWADPEQMFRILMNLIRNGVEALDRAGPERGRKALVIVGATQNGAGSLIEIADTGPGVPASVRAQLFTPFSDSARPGGSGLGLAIAADLVRANGGKISLIAEGEDEGATFRITLPPRPAGSRA